jgi:polyisoprenoid-binding protein YceI
MSRGQLTAAITDLTGDYQLDPAHTRFGFVARHAMVTKVRGSFKEFDAQVHIDAANPEASTATITMKAASIDTGQEQRDAHLRSGDFLEADTYPDVTFVATAVEQLDDERFRLTGDLTVKDVTKPVTVELEHTGTAKDPYGNLRAGFDGKARISRKDWGLTWNATLETGGFLVSDRVDLEFDISAIKIA